jgi:hypothetical protein
MAYTQVRVLGAHARRGWARLGQINYRKDQVVPFAEIRKTEIRNSAVHVEDVPHEPGEPYLFEGSGSLDGKWCVDCSCGNYHAYDDSSEVAEHAARKHAEDPNPPRVVTHELSGPYWYYNNMWRATVSGSPPH